jgi:hypothetical protein
MLCCEFRTSIASWLMPRRYDQLVWSLPRVLFHPSTRWTIGNSDILDWVDSTLLLSSFGMHLRSTIRCRISQTSHCRRRVDLRLLHDDDLYCDRILANPSCSRYRSGAWDGVDILTKCRNSQSSFCQEQISDARLWLSGEWKCRRRSHCADHVAVSLPSCRVWMGDEDS